MAIEIRQLRYAVATADTMSFSRAAGSLNVKQSTLSKCVATLEVQLGVKLFERTTRGAITLESSKVFIEIARRILTEIDNLKTTARAVEYGEMGKIVVGFSTSLSAGNLKSKRGLQAAVYAAGASVAFVGGRQFHGMSSSQRAAGQSFAILVMTSAI